MIYLSLIKVKVTKSQNIDLTEGVFGQAGRDKHVNTDREGTCQNLKPRQTGEKKIPKLKERKAWI